MNIWSHVPDPTVLRSAGNELLLISSSFFFQFDRVLVQSLFFSLSSDSISSKAWMVFVQ